MPKVARVDDTISHGGEIIEGSPDVEANGKAVARLGDKVKCRVHGTKVIATASETVFANGKGVARIGDAISCGAVIITGSPDVEAD